MNALADAHFAAGVKAYDRKDFETALEEFRHTYKLSPSAAVLRNIAKCELKTGKPLEALAAFRAYVSDPAVPKRTRQQAEASIAEAYHQTGHLNVMHEAGAHVRIDGADAELVEGAYDVTAGTHEVQVTAGDRAGAKRVDAPPGRVTIVEVSLEKVVPAAPILAPVSATPSSNTPSPAATSTSAERSATPSTSSSSSARWITAGSVGAVGVAGLVLGGVFAAKASSAHGDVTSLVRGAVCPSDPRCAQASDRLSAYGDDHNVSVASLAVGGALVAASVVVAILWPRSASDGAAAKTTLPAPVGQGLSFTF